jgi:outer membrane lipoprotein-sorting protein
MNSYYDDINAKFTDDGKTDIRKIEAKPKSADDNLNKLLITLNVKTLEIKDIHIFDNNGNEFVYIIKTFVTNQELPADYFTFKESAYPDAEVIDMR